MIAIIDYGMGNLRSVQKAFEYIGYRAEITSDPEKILRSDKVVLPGVGAFSDAMCNLRSMGMTDAIHMAVKSGRPFLGICLGMQLLMECSYEGGAVSGLGFIQGDVKRIPSLPELKIPHMGWNELIAAGDTPIFAGLHPHANVYFVHSYHVDPLETGTVTAVTDYGIKIPAAVQKDNIYGLQFHPEKSGEIGLQILRNFGGLT